MKIYDASLCLTCDEVSDGQSTACPSCGDYTVRLSDLIRPVSDKQEIDAVRRLGILWPDREIDPIVLEMRSA